MKWWRMTKQSVAIGGGLLECRIVQQVRSNSDLLETIKRGVRELEINVNFSTVEEELLSLRENF